MTKNGCLIAIVGGLIAWCAAIGAIQGLVNYLPYDGDHDKGRIYLSIALVLGVLGITLIESGILSAFSNDRTHDGLAAYFYTVVGACMIAAAVGVALLIDSNLNTADDDRAEMALASRLLCTAAVVGLLHLAAKVLIQRRIKKTFADIRRAYLFCMLGIASLAGLFLLPMSIYDLVRQYAEEDLHTNPPHASAAIFVAVLPLWVYYLYRVIREEARRKKEGDSSASKTASPTTTIT